MVAMMKPEQKVAIPKRISENLIVKCETDSDFDIQNVIDNIIVVERVKNETPRDIMEKITQISATIFCILSAFSSFASVTLMAIRLYHMAIHYNISDDLDYQNRLIICTLTMTITYSAVSYIFYILLLKGMKTRKSMLVLAHFVYGVINITFALAFLIAAIIIKDSQIFASSHTIISNNQILAGITVYVSCMMIYALFLCFVWMVYEGYAQKELSQAEAKRMEPYTLPLKFSRRPKTMAAQVV